MHDYICGIQQIGIGVKNVRECMLKYKELFGMNVLVFDDTSDAALMTKYTGGVVYNRQAVLSLNLKGGGGFEIWQFKSRQPAEPLQPPLYGDLGIYAAKIKSADVKQAYTTLSSSNCLKVSPIQHDPAGAFHFWVKDAYGNVFNVVEGNHWFRKNGAPIGGVTGAVIGVSDMNSAIDFYSDVLGISEVVYDTVEVADAPELEPQKFHRVLLRKHPSGKGAFGKLLGSVEVELVQCLERKPQKIYADRYWGDCGFIHLCFDVCNMNALKQHAAAYGIQFTVDSIDSFDMENASGRFCYMEDPDGTLIELVETHKVPILKKFGWYLDLKKRSLEKPLPDWMISMLSLSKVK